MNLLKYNNIIFDLDGTIADTAPDILKCIRKSFQHVPRLQKINLEKVIIGPPLSEVAKHIAPDMSDAESDLFTNGFRKCYDNDDFSGTKLYDGVRETIETLVLNSVKLFVVTNKPLLPTKRILFTLNINQYFTGIFCPDINKNKKLTKVDLINMVLGNYQLKRKETLMVGDIITDIASAHDTGVDSLAVTYGYGEQMELEKEKPKYIIQKFSEILSINKLNIIN